MKKVLSFLVMMGGSNILSANDVNQTPIELNQTQIESNNSLVKDTNSQSREENNSDSNQSLIESNQSSIKTTQVETKNSINTNDTNQTIIENNQSQDKETQVITKNSADSNQSLIESNQSSIKTTQVETKKSITTNDTNQTIIENNQSQVNIEQNSTNINQSSSVIEPQSNIESTFIDQATSILQKRVKHYPRLGRLYKELFYTPVWVTYNGLTNFGKGLIKQIDEDITIPSTLKLHQRVQKLRESIDNPNSSSTIQNKIDNELKFSNLYIDYMNYLIYGGINWNAFDKKVKKLTREYKIKVGWEHYKPSITPDSLLVDATMSGDLNSAFKKAEPKRFKYQQLKNSLIKYIKLSKSGAWKSLPKFKKIKAGNRSPAISIVRQDLILSGDFNQNSDKNETQSNFTLYDKSLQEAVKRFKVRHGLKATTTIDQDTRYWFNLPIERKIEILRLNLDRIKWLWRDEANVRIELNIPAFRLYLYEGKHLVDTIRVVTGRPNHPTPIFHNIMQYIVVNPYWKIPESIVKSEMLRHLINDPYYYERRGKVLHSDWGEDSPRVDPGSVNWAKYRAKGRHIPYYFMQLPGTSNALGKIKFLFPNKYSVYIHDTPSKRLFFKNIRAFSHGCMRIQKPRELLKVLAQYNDNIDVDAIMAQLKTRKKDTISLRHPIPVDIVYLTSFIDDYGNLNFRKDIYGYDKFQMKYYAYNPNHKLWNYRSNKKDTKSK